MSAVAPSTRPARHRDGPLKIAVATWAPFVGGAEVAGERLALGLAEAGCEVVVIVGEDNEVLARLQSAGLRCVYSQMYLTDKWRPLRYVRARRALTRVLRSEQPALVHSNDLPTHQFVSDAARRLRIPRISHHRYPFGGRATDWLNKYGCERHLFVSQALMQDVCRESHEIAGSPRAVVYDGLPIPRLPSEADRAAARAELNLPLEKTIVTFAGQIVERKGVADLLRAWAMLPAWRDRTELIIIGDDLEKQGRYLEEMKRLDGELGAAARFVGFQRNVPTWLTATDVAVVPSHVEPLGNATLEAMAHGLPVIGGDVGGIPEMIVEEQTGLLVPPRAPEQLAAALERLLADRALRLRLGAAARARCEQHFSLSAHVESVLEQYQQTLAALTAP